MIVTSIIIQLKTFVEEKDVAVKRYEKTCLFGQINYTVIMKVFWEKAKNEIVQQNTSFEWLCLTTGIPKGTFATWKKRDVLPRVDEALKIAQALNVSLEYLVTGTIEGSKTTMSSFLCRITLSHCTK